MKNKFQKKGKVRAKKYPENPEFVDSPQIFSDFLKVSCLTREQMDVFQCKERFVFVEGPAGSGKTIAMLGKIIDLALNTPSSSRILLIVTGNESATMIESHTNLLNSIRKDIKCVNIQYNLSVEISNRLIMMGITMNNYMRVVEKKFLDEVKESDSKIVLMSFDGTMAKNMRKVLKRFDYIFVDDFQTFADLTTAGIVVFRHKLPLESTDNLISEGLIPVIRYSASNKTSVWIFSDEGQSVAYWNKRTRKNLSTIFGDTVTNMFKKQILLSVNLRNTYEISTVLSVMREVFGRMDGTLKFQKQRRGHFLRGKRPVFYFLRGNKTATWRNILKEELQSLISHNSNLPSKEIAVMHDYEDSNDAQTFEVVQYINEWKTNAVGGDEITLGGRDTCVSGEWTAVVSINRFVLYPLGQDMDYVKENFENLPFSYAAPFLYCTLSRARVYAVMVIYDYKPGYCKMTDTLLSALKYRSDVCTVIEG